MRTLVQRHNWAIFLENEQGKAVTVNGDSYRAMLNEFLFTQIKEEDIGNNWFQQDGATCYTAEATLGFSSKMSKERSLQSMVIVIWPF